MLTTTGRLQKVLSGQVNTDNALCLYLDQEKGDFENRTDSVQDPNCKPPGLLASWPLGPITKKNPR